jgi:hypothetical protein
LTCPQRRQQYCSITTSYFHRGIRFVPDLHSQCIRFIRHHGSTWKHTHNLSFIRINHVRFVCALIAVVTRVHHFRTLAPRGPEVTAAVQGVDPAVRRIKKRRLIIVEQWTILLVHWLHHTTRTYAWSIPKPFKSYCPLYDCCRSLLSRTLLAGQGKARTEPQFVQTWLLWRLLASYRYIQP